MVVFLLQQLAILCVWLRLPESRKLSADWRSIRFYGGAPAPFIGAPGSILVLVGSHMPVARRSGSPPRLIRPWTRSIRAKVARRGRQAADGAERLAGAAEVVVEPTMTIFLERCAVQPLYHQRGKSWLSWRRRRGFVDSFIIRMAAGMLASPCGCCRGHVRPAALA